MLDIYMNSSPNSLGVFIFRRDYRLEDNRGLLRLASTCHHILPVFIFDSRQVDSKKNKYFSAHSFQFLLESLSDLDESIRKQSNGTCQLYCFQGHPPDILTQLKTNVPFEFVGWNIDYTPFSNSRDAEMKTWCQHNNIQVIETEDITLLPIGSLTTSSGTVYKKFTPFYNAAMELPIDEPSIKKVKNWYSLHDSIYKLVDSLSLEEFKRPYIVNPKLFAHGGRSNAIHILEDIERGKYKSYKDTRDYPSLESTTGMSAYLKYGCLSIREVYHTIAISHGVEHELIRQLWWREFYYNIAFGYPHVFGHAFNQKYDNLDWDNNQEWFQRWCEGNTGFPIIDAGMRQLNTTGYMHNRLRMMVSMFLTKDLLIDWRWGEQYFATQLVDYDPAQNNGGWQWSASTGVDAQPYFRIFNPWTMTRKVDADCAYIKKWVEELKDVPNQLILEWDTECETQTDIKYVCPMVEHSEQREIALGMFKKE